MASHFADRLVLQGAVEMSNRYRIDIKLVISTSSLDFETNLISHWGKLKKKPPKDERVFAFQGRASSLT